MCLSIRSGIYTAGAAVLRPPAGPGISGREWAVVHGSTRLSLNPLSLGCGQLSGGSKPGRVGSGKAERRPQAPGFLSRGDKIITHSGATLYRMLWVLESVGCV